VADSTDPESGRTLAYRWVRATGLGWVLGVPLIVAFALLGEAVGVGGAQVLVGAGMGAGVGLLQARVIRTVTHRAAPWFWSSAAGLSLPFLATDMAKAAGWASAYSPYASLAVGGIIVGAWQSLLLRPHVPNTRWWLVASALGWTLAGGAAALADSLSRVYSMRGIAGALVFLGPAAVGGLVLGLVTALPLARMVRAESAGRTELTT